MRVLLTTDTWGGIGSFTRELALGLAERGHEVALASFGPAATLAWASGRAIACRVSPLPLEWMPRAGALAEAARRWVEDLAAEFRPDILHANHFAFAAAPVAAATVMTVHSDVVSWWRAVHGGAPPASAWRDAYVAQAQAALRRCAAAVVPTAAAAADIRASFGTSVAMQVIANGMTPATTAPSPKRPVALAAGRIWDAGKQMALLFRRDLPLPLRLAGPCEAPAEAGCARVRVPALPRLEYLGALAHEPLQRAMAEAAIFVSPSRYEPFGLAALEAAWAGCALLLNDRPSLREVWGGAAAYFRRDDGDDMVRQLAALAGDDARRERLAAAARQRAERLYSRELMTVRYLRLYAALAQRAGTAAQAG
ncbi:MAG TPA: glycosyltransferase family 4 protein [Terriglobales bacterium]|nr:glycosyltransferase family 4 protein [Terriglobales bacterium]